MASRSGPHATVAVLAPRLLNLVPKHAAREGGIHHAPNGSPATRSGAVGKQSTQGADPRAPALSGRVGRQVAARSGRFLPVLTGASGSLRARDGAQGPGGSAGARGLGGDGNEAWRLRRQGRQEHGGHRVRLPFDQGREDGRHHSRVPGTQSEGDRRAHRRHPRRDTDHQPDVDGVVQVADDREDAQHSGLLSASQRAALLERGGASDVRGGAHGGRARGVHRLGRRRRHQRHAVSDAPPRRRAHRRHGRSGHGEGRVQLGQAGARRRRRQRALLHPP